MYCKLVDFLFAILRLKVVNAMKLTIMLLFHFVRGLEARWNGGHVEFPRISKFDMAFRLKQFEISLIEFGRQFDVL